MIPTREQGSSIEGTPLLDVSSLDRLIESLDMVTIGVITTTIIVDFHHHLKLLHSTHLGYHTVMNNPNTILTL